MDDLGLPALTGGAVTLAAFTVSIIDAFKKYILRGWAEKVPGVIFYILALAIPVGVCVGLNLDWFDALAGGKIPTNLEGFSTIATGILVGLGASGSYKAKEVAKAALAPKPTPDNSQNGNTTTQNGNVPNLEQHESIVKVTPPAVQKVQQPTARMFIEVTPQAGPGRFVLIEDEKGQHLYPLDRSSPTVE